MQRYTIFFITVNAARVSGGFSAHHQELGTVCATIRCVSCEVPSSVEPTISAGERPQTYALDRAATAGTGSTRDKQATRYGLDGPGIESRWGRDFPHLSRPALGFTQPPVQWVQGLFRG
jgi:hypothetical protein